MTKPQYSPRLVVKFRDDVELPYDDSVDRTLEMIRIGPWRELKAQFPGISIRGLVNSVKPSRIRELAVQAAGRDKSYRPPNFLTYFIVDLPEAADPEKIVRSLSTWPAVETAYFDPPADNPNVTRTDPRLPGQDPDMLQQGYLAEAPDGIDAFFAWGVPGGDGAGQRFIDLEMGWTLDHEDLAGHGVQLLFGDDEDASHPHGTNVLGIVCALANTVGCRGIAHNVDFVRVVSHAGILNHVGNAIEAAIDALPFGGVLLLEVQRGNRPVELLHADYAYIRQATAKGITVVEAAGNGGFNLDHSKDALGNRVLAKGVRDSGAILVGAAKSALPHIRMPSSNFGSRVDCYAWGENVFTPTSSATAPFLKHGNNPTFDGTSSAAAIIAGAALVVQGIAMSRNASKLLDAFQMRDLLGSHALGTASGNPVGGINGIPPADRIGVMPNLRAIIGLPDLFAPNVPPGP